MTLLSSTLYQEIQDIIVKHITELKHYIPINATCEWTIPDTLLMCVERLSQISLSAPTLANYDLYAEACDRYNDLKCFLMNMNCANQPDFSESIIGQIWDQTANWLQTAEKQFCPSVDAWDFIAPVVPDRLVDLGNGQFEARWWKPVPMMDVEILKHTEGVNIQGETFEPKSLVGGLACRFSLSVFSEQK
jgi:hypothetical protein